MESAERKTITLRFNTKENHVEARALADNLYALANAIERANPDGTPNDSIAVNVTAIQDGCFETVIEVIRQGGALIAAVGVDNVGSIIKHVISYLSIRKAIGDTPISVTGKNADETLNIATKGGLQFNNCSGITVNMLHDPNINRPYAKAMGSLKSENDIKGISILDESDTELIKIEPGEYTSFQRSNSGEDEHPDKRDIIHNAVLFIRKIDFAGRNRKWGFVYNDSAVTMKVGDKEFWDETIVGNQKFANGDKLEANIEVLRQYDKASRQYMIKAYTIIKVIQHIPVVASSA